MKKTTKILAAILAVCMVMSMSVLASADSAFPKQAINIVVPKGAGGPTDTATRILAKYAEQYDDNLSFVIENVTGANGVTGMTKGALAKADGYTLTMIVVELAMMQNLPSFNCAVSTDDFRVINICTANTVALCTRHGEYADIYDFVDKMTADTKVGDSGIYGISNIGFKSAAEGWGKEYKAVPYSDGDSASIAALIADNSEVDAICCCGSGTLTSQIEAGAIDVLCVMGNEPLSSAPDAPLVKDLKEGYALDLSVNAWCGVAVPDDTPDDVYNYLVDVFTYASNCEGFWDELVASGTAPAAINGADAQALVDNDTVFYAEMLKDAA